VNLPATFFLLLVHLLWSANAIACSCYDEIHYLQPGSWSAKDVASTSDIIHARVIEVLPSGNARIQSLKVLKGAGEVQVLSPDARLPTCEIRFKRGEEFIYLLDANASVHLCNRLKPTRRLLRHIEGALAKNATSTSEAQKR
jgi:hypothetical protein